MKYKLIENATFHRVKYAAGDTFHLTWDILDGISIVVYDKVMQEDGNVDHALVIITEENGKLEGLALLGVTI